MRRVQVEPHLSVTGACSAEWLPIKPKTDAAFLYALAHVLVNEEARERLDVEFLYRHTSSPYLVGAHGYYLRDPQTREPLIAPKLEGKFVRRSVEIGPDDEVLAAGELEGETAFTKLVAHLRPYSPEWAAAICDIHADTIRRVAERYLKDADLWPQILELSGIASPAGAASVSSSDASSCSRASLISSLTTSARRADP